MIGFTEVRRNYQLGIAKIKIKHQRTDRKKN